VGRPGTLFPGPDFFFEGCRCWEILIENQGSDSSADLQIRATNCLSQRAAGFFFFEQNEHEMSRFWSGGWTLGGRTFVPSIESTDILSPNFFF
jgi:hypothetical protein